MVARYLGVSLDELIGEQPKPGKREPVPKIQQQLKHISQPPKAKQKVVMKMLDGVLSQAGR